MGLPRRDLLLFGGRPAFDPRSVAGCVLWLRADALALAGGAGVAAWADQSGQGNSAAQATGLNQPTFQVAQINGLPALSFDGTHSFMTGAIGSLTADHSRTGFAVLQAGGTNVYGTAFNVGTSAGNSAWGFGLNNDGKYVEFQWGGDLEGTAYTTAVQLVSALKSADNLSIYVDGALNAGPTAEAAANVTGTAYAIGQLVDGATIAFTGLLAELLVYNAALTSADRHAVEAYLAAKYGLAVVQQ